MSKSIISNAYQCIDGEYYRIMDKLNSKHMADMRGGESDE